MEKQNTFKNKQERMKMDTASYLRLHLRRKVLGGGLRERLRRNFYAVCCPSLIVLLRDVRYD